jgi:pimeloyl-ACP methyl ester carboxylesterase
MLVVSGSVELHVDCVGAGPVVVLTHGLGDRAATWASMVPLLTTDHAVVSWDLRGHGASASPTSAESYSMETAVADLLAVIDRTAPPDAHVDLVGHSLGGFLSLAVALRCPDRVHTLTMIASGPGYRDPAARDEWNRYVDTAVLRMPVPREAAALAHQSDAAVIDAVSTLEPPLLVVVGERDTRFHAGAAYLERAVPGTVTYRVADAGHFPQRTHAAEVTRIVQRHIAPDRSRW